MTPEREDNGESVALMEPMLPSESGKWDRALTDLAVELVSKASALAGQIHPDVQSAIGALVRSMNCYYSNLIEGHDTHPIDIDRALKADFAREPKKRALQLEAKAHIEVQAELDARARDAGPRALSAEMAVELHRGFCERLPDELLWVENPETHERLQVVPGQLRPRHVRVGRHIPPSPGSLPRFLARFEQAYAFESLSRVRQLVAVAAAHHRLLWIHPFLDGNGRVTRLMSHAALRELGVGTSLWSVARGLARRVQEYKRLLQDADAERQGDLDGRGARSEERLASFCEFFLSVCVDQVEFMQRLLQPATLLGRIDQWIALEVSAGRLHPKASMVMREAVQVGRVERGRLPVLTGLSERQARTVVAELTKRGVLTAESHRAPLRVGFPVEVVEGWFPALYPGVG